MKARYTGKTRLPRMRRQPPAQGGALRDAWAARPIADLVAMPVDALIAFFAGLELDGHDTNTAARILVEIRNRLQYLADVGLGYLTLDRLRSTLSGGESRSASTSRRRWAATSPVRSTSSTNLRSACIRATRTA